MKSISKTRNYSIDYFKYFCSLLVIAIHVHPFSDISKNADTFFIDSITRIAVPFFFVVSGYFYTRQAKSQHSPYKKYVLKIFTVYTFWSIVYASKIILQHFYHHTISFAIIKDLIIKYFLFGTSEHLWYCISLLISITMLMIIHKLKLIKYIGVFSIIIGVISCLCVTYGTLIGCYIPILKKLITYEFFYTGIFRLLLFGQGFVFLGAFVANDERIINTNHINRWMCIFLVFYIIEKTIVYIHYKGSVITFTLYPLMLCILIYLLKHPGTNNLKFSAYSRNAASFNYYSHILMLFIVRQITHLHTIQYIAVAVCCTAVSVVISKINNKYLNYFLM